MTKSLELAKLTVCLTASLLMASVAQSTQAKADGDVSVSQGYDGFDDWDDYEEEDETEPTISGVEDKAYYNEDREITFEDDIELSAIYVNGEEQEFPAGRIASITVSAEGDYDIRVVDSSGNESSVSFVIDKTAPVIKGVKDGRTYGKKRKIKYSDEGSGVDEAKYTLKNAGYNEKYRNTLDLKGTWIIRESNNVSNAKLKNNTTFFRDGDYTLVVTDKAGNTAEVNFTLKDKTDFSVRFLGLNPWHKKIGYKVGKDLRKKDKQVLVTKGEKDGGMGFSIDLRGNGKDWADQVEWIRVGYGKNSYPKKTTSYIAGTTRNFKLYLDKSNGKMEMVREDAEGYRELKESKFIGMFSGDSMSINDNKRGIYKGYKMLNTDVTSDYCDSYTGSFAVTGYYTLEVKENTGRISTYHFRVVNKTTNKGMIASNKAHLKNSSKLLGYADE